MATNQPHPDIDWKKVDAIRERYTAEANKRQRPEGLGQFLQLTETDEKRLYDLAEDPWADHKLLNSQKSPIENNGIYRFLIVGTGFGGLQFAANLIEAGVARTNEIRLIDAGGGFGGTWYWNRFPGLHCDQESYIYLPLLEKTGYIPTQKYARGEEIREHANRIASHWDLIDKTLFRTDVKSIEWSDETKLWSIRAIEGRGPGFSPITRQLQAEYVYLSGGTLTKPQIPKIPGLLSFHGPMFHTARWNYNISGGSPTNQKLTGLEDKKVAVVGNGATAIGVIPELASYSKELYIFQRTPAYVKPRNQKQTPADFRNTIANTNDWQFKRQLNFNSFLTNSALPGEPNLVNDGWTDIPAYSAVVGSPSHGIVDSSPQKLDEKDRWFHALDLPHMDGIRASIDRIVHDRDTAEKLKPWYASWCKRLVVSSLSDNSYEWIEN